MPLRAGLVVGDSRGEGPGACPSDPVAGAAALNSAAVSCSTAIARIRPADAVGLGDTVLILV